MSEKPAVPTQYLVKTSSEAAPALLGAAAGIFLGDLMHSGARRPVAFALACLGVAALTPSVVEVVRDKVAGPNTRRGSQRTLRSIREGSGASSAEDFYEEEQLYVG